MLPPNDYLSTMEACRALGQSKETLHGLRRGGTLVAHRVGNAANAAWAWCRDSIDAELSVRKSIERARAKPERVK